MKAAKTLICTVSVLCLGAFLSGCASKPPVKLYDGSERPAVQTAMLKCEASKFLGLDSSIAAVKNVWDCNDKLIWTGHDHAFYMLPGQYTLEVYLDLGGGAPNGAIAGAAAGFANQTAAKRTTTTVKTSFDAGKEYALKIKRHGLTVFTITADFWIEDANTGAVTYGEKPK